MRRLTKRQVKQARRLASAQAWREQMARWAMERGEAQEADRLMASAAAAERELDGLGKAVGR